MANYYSKTRTNSFEITDENAFRKICNELESTEGDEVEIYTKTDENGRIFGTIACEGSLMILNSCNEDEEDDPENFYKKIQPILADDSVMVVIEIGYEKLRYLTAYADIVTKSEIKYKSLTRSVEEIVQQMLNKDKWQFEWDI